MESQFAALAVKLDGWRYQMQTDREASKTTDLKANPEEMKSESEHRKVPKEDAVGKPVKGPKKRHRGRKLAAGRHGEPKELTRGDCGYGRKLAATCRKVSRRARVAWRKRNIVRNKWTRAKDERGIRRIRTLREIGRTRQKGRKGVKDLGDRRPLCLRKETTTKRGIGGWISRQGSDLGNGGALNKNLYEILDGRSRNK
jgi:hypothetical protein